MGSAAVTTSGSTDFALTTDEIVEKAFNLLGVGSIGETLTARHYEDGRLSLNLMVKSWATSEHLWLRTERSVTLVAAQTSYTLTPKPMRVIEVRRKVTASSIETPLTEWARAQYIEMPNKTTASIPTAFYYDPQLAGGSLYIWPTASTSTAADMTLVLTYWRTIEDFDTAANNPDLPQEWLEAIVWNLAAALIAEYPVNDPSVAGRIDRRAALLLAQLQSFDTEPASLYLQPDWQG